MNFIGLHVMLHFHTYWQIQYNLANIQFWIIKLTYRSVSSEDLSHNQKHHLLFSCNMTSFSTWTNIQNKEKFHECNQIYYIYIVHVLLLKICGMYNIILSCQILSLGSNLLLSIVTAKNSSFGRKTIFSCINGNCTGPTRWKCTTEISKGIKLINISLEPKGC